MARPGVVGHLGVWNGEAACSLQAHTGGAKYRCIPSPQYDEYNRAAARERSTWPMERVWADYEASGDQLRTVVEALPAEKWNAEILYPWSERGTVRRLVEIMMRHEAEHREGVGRVPGVTHAP